MGERRITSVCIRGNAPCPTAYVRGGSGEPLLLIHGVGMNAMIWQPQFELLKDRFDLIAIDMLGHGKSELPPENASLADYADQAIGLLDSLDLTSVSIVGHSMGALVAQEIALRAPRRVRRLVSLNAVFRRPPALAEAVRARAAKLSGHGDPAGITDTVARWFGDPVPAGLAKTAEETRRSLQSVNLEGYARTYRLFARADMEHVERLANLAMPALFMTGSDDKNSSPAMSAAMARLAPHGRCLILDGERHMMAIASPEKVVRHIAAFLEGDHATKTSGKAEMDSAFDTGEFRRALGSFLTGVTIVTTIGPDGEPRGFTANSFTSVSLDPPLVLVCISKQANGHPVFATSKAFAVNVLSEGQKAASGVFASKAADKFAAVEWRPGMTGSPVIDESVATFDCDLDQLVDAGDHSLLIGRVRNFSHVASQPLGYCRGGYVNLGLSQEALATAPENMAVGAILEYEGQVLFFEMADGLYELPAGRSLGTASDAKSLKGRFADKAIEAHLDFLYAVWEDSAQPTRFYVYYRGTVDGSRPNHPGVRLVAIGDIAKLRVADPAVRSMLGRYVRERTEDAFGVYVGNKLEGEVRTLV
jgi:flavin reductase (DIM6/NTAB) family NADH-FMN oxidoreductase RutF/pimeloyl-ACP methyl ester carboxylesterase